MTESQKKAVALLQEIYQVCEEKGMHFYLLNETALQGFRSNGFEYEKPEIFITMLYKDMMNLVRGLKEKNLASREFESLYSNGLLYSNFFRYVDSESLYWPVKNPLNLKKFGIAITIIPLFSTKVDSKRSLKKYLYLYWSQNLGTNWTTKANSFVAKATRNISTRICKKASNRTRCRLLNKLYQFEESATIDDKLYMYKGKKRKRIEFKKGFFKDTLEIDFHGVKCNIPSNFNTYFTKMIGSRWKEKTYKAKDMQKFLLVDDLIPYKEYFDELEAKNIIFDISEDVQKEEIATVEYKKYDKITKAAWNIVLRTDSRIRLYQEYFSKKETILQLYEKEEWNELGDILANFDLENRVLAKKKMSVSMDKDIWNIYLEWLRRNGEGNFAKKIDAWLPDEYRENLIIEM